MIILNILLLLKLSKTNPKFIFIDINNINLILLYKNNVNDNRLSKTNFKTTRKR